MQWEGTPGKTDALPEGPFYTMHSSGPSFAFQLQLLSIVPSLCAILPVSPVVTQDLRLQRDILCSNASPPRWLPFSNLQSETGDIRCSNALPKPGMPCIRLGVWFPQPCHASMPTACAVVRISTGWGVVLCLTDFPVANLPDGSF